MKNPRLLTATFFHAFHFIAFAFVGFAGLSATTSSWARAEFTPQALEKAMLDVYCTYPDQPVGACAASEALSTVSGDAPAARDARLADFNDDPNLPQAPQISAANRHYWLLEIFDQTALLDTDGFNDVMRHMAADYRHHPEHRDAIEAYMASIDVGQSAGIGGQVDHAADAVRAALREELDQLEARSPILDTMERVVQTFAFAYTFEFGRGWFQGRALWGKGAQELTRLQRFQRMGELYVESAKRAGDFTKLHRLKIFAAGLGVGATEAVVRSFVMFKLDPRHLLEPIQEDIARALAQEVVRYRDEVRAMAVQAPANALERTNAIGKRLLEIERETQPFFSQHKHLLSQARPIAQDIVETRKTMNELRPRLIAAKAANTPTSKSAPKTRLP